MLVEPLIMLLGPPVMLEGPPVMLVGPFVVLVGPHVMSVGPLSVLVKPPVIVVLLATQYFHQFGPSGPSWSKSPHVCLYVCAIGCSFFLGLSLVLR